MSRLTWGFWKALSRIANSIMETDWLRFSPTLPPFLQRTAVLPLGIAVLLSGLASSQAATFRATSSEVNPGAAVRGRILVEDFQNIVAFQGTLAWDPAVIQFQELDDFGLPFLSAGSFGVNSTDEGYLTFSWDEQADLFTGQTLSDGATLFSVRFTAIGNAGASSSVQFRDDPTLREVVDNSLTVVEFDSQNGSVTLVEAVNTPPSISFIEDRAFDEDASATINFTVQDAETNAVDLIVGAASSNAALIDQTGFAFSGSGANRSLTLTPKPDAFGSAVVTVSVSDGQSQAEAQFNLTVQAVNDPPRITGLPNEAIVEEDQASEWPFQISDVDDDADNLSVEAESTNESLVSLAGLSLSGTGEDRVLRIQPEVAASGNAGIRVIVDDGEAATTHVIDFTVTAVNDVPTISSIEDQRILEDVSLPDLAFTLGDEETDADNLQLAILSDNPGLLDSDDFVVTGSGGNRILTGTPKSNQHGEANVTLEVSDGENTVSTQFKVTVDPVNDAPVLSAIEDKAMQEGTSLEIPFTIEDAETNADDLILSLTTQNPEALGESDLVLSGSGGDRVLTATAQSGISGVAGLTLTVSDGELSAERIFEIRVVPLNQPPTLLGLPGVVSMEEDGLSTLPFSVDDGDSAIEALVLTVAADNEQLFPSGTASVSGTGGSRELILQPAANAFGDSEVRLTLSDGISETTHVIAVAVSPVNDAPVVASIPDLEIQEDQALPATEIVIQDVDNELSALTIALESTNLELFDETSLSLELIEGQFVLTGQPLVNAFGESEIVMRAGDEETETEARFIIRVQPVNDAPVLSAIPDRAVEEDGELAPVEFDVFDPDDPLDELEITVQSSNADLVDDASLTIEGDGGGKSLRLALIENAFGQSTLTLRVRDQELETSQSFLLNVTPVNDPPIISDIEDQVMEMDGELRLSVFVDDVESGPDVLRFSFFSRNRSLIAEEDIEVLGEGTEAILVIRPKPGKTGSAELTFFVEDDERTFASRLFEIQVVDASQSIRVQAERQGDAMVITWDGEGALQSALSVEGPFQTVSGAASPFSVGLDGIQFFRVMREQE